jgi:putative ABC transport system substrate-binding protein
MMALRRCRARSITYVTAVVILLLAGRGLAQAQRPGTVPRIGFLSYFGCAKSLAPDGTFRQGLAALGYVEGRGLAIECRDAPGQVDRLVDLAAELIRLKVDVLVTEATPASLAARRATTTIPIVFLSVADPIASGLVASLPRPGGNVTGVSLFPVLEVVPKVLELLKEVAPHVTRTAILMDRTNPAQVLTDDTVDAVGRVLRMQPLRFGVRRTTDLPPAFTAALNQRSQALFVYPLPVEAADVRRIAEFALARRLPAVTFWEGYAEQGFLIFYGTGISDQYRRACVYIDKILRGAKPADLPVEQPTTLQMVINLRTATALGLTIGPSVLARADKVIE